VKISRRQSVAAIAAAAAVTPRFAKAADGAPPKKIRLVVLDVGGTLIPDHGEVPDAMLSALGKRDVTVTPAEIAEWRGASKRGMVRHFVELRAKKDADHAALTEAIYADFSAQVTRAYAEVQPIAGAEQAIAEMRKMGLLLATTTGFDRPLTDAIFRRLKWHDLFVTSVTSDDVVDGRPSPFMIFHAMEAAHVDAVAEVVVVGDTPLDLQAAANAGARGMVGVYSGAATEARLEREPHTHILPSVAGLPKVLREAF
jgi:phosphonatase-like hydrolase